jgi:hypothetical protein
MVHRYLAYKTPYDRHRALGIVLLYDPTVRSYCTIMGGVWWFLTSEVGLYCKPRNRPVSTSVHGRDAEIIQ